jgi:outer membrane beta-barrel protein
MFKFTIMMITLSFATQSFAQSNAPAKPTTTETRDSDKLDIRKLEQKYWSAKDDDFSVVQNRKYTKAQRFYLNVAAGIPVNDPFTTGTLTSFQLGYFFNERLGVDVNLTSGNLKNNNATSAFFDRFGSLPDYNVFSSSKTLSVTYVPLYAKMSFLDSSIIYFDMGFSVGLGTTDYKIKKSEGDEAKSAPSYQWSVNQQIFFSDHFAVRIDLINRYTKEDKLKYTAGSPARDQGSKNINDTSFLLGLTYWH